MITEVTISFILFLITLFVVNDLEDIIFRR